MALHHKATFLSHLSKGGSHWRLLSQLPHLDQDRFGHKLSQAEFEETFGGDAPTFFQALFSIHEGELLQLDLIAWLGRDDLEGRGCIDNALFISAWHVQYAISYAQRRRMVKLGLPGTQAKLTIGSLANQTWVSEATLQTIGDTTVCKLDNMGFPEKLVEAKVVTWPQLFLFGAVWGYSAQEIYTAGCQLERILTRRERSQSSRFAQDAAILRQATTGRFKQR